MNYRKETTKHQLKEQLFPLDASNSFAYVLPGITVVRNPNISHIIQYVAKLQHVTVEEMMGEDRHQEFVDGRKLVSLFASDHRFLNMSLRIVGELFKPFKDHATVLHAKRSAWILIETNHVFREKYLAVKDYFFIS